MKQNKTYLSIIRFFMVLIAVICVVFSSCVVKNSVKSALFGNSAQFSQQKGVKTFIVHGNASCDLSSSKENAPYHISKSVNFTPSDIALFSSIFNLLFSPVLTEVIPAYYASSTKIPQSLPIFIHCRKLII